ncbi:hypothetical protein EUGRSUZ_H04844 [Eucalyptus grandis]|uniref:Uncharacterized protein n=2 Tax=Eucalyptus grandis TaxID=71139 RepID=A0ACC3JXX7_EUCGR|nr:hypothetical protein EUGRSUZ_H04844 [Eucalyptus grandis]
MFHVKYDRIRRSHRVAFHNMNFVVIYHSSCNHFHMSESHFFSQTSSRSRIKCQELVRRLMPYSSSL